MLLGTGQGRSLSSCFQPESSGMNITGPDAGIAKRVMMDTTACCQLPLVRRHTRCSLPERDGGEPLITPTD